MLLVRNARSKLPSVPTKLFASALLLPPSAQKLPVTSEMERLRTRPFESMDSRLSEPCPVGTPTRVSGLVPPCGLIVTPPEALTVKTLARFAPLRPCSCNRSPLLPSAPTTTSPGVLLAEVRTSRMPDGAAGVGPALMARRPVAKSP